MKNVKSNGYSDSHLAKDLCLAIAKLAKQNFSSALAEPNTGPQIMQILCSALQHNQLNSFRTDSLEVMQIMLQMAPDGKKVLIASSKYIYLLQGNKYF